MYVIATFPDRASAEQAMRDLEAAAFARSGMTLVLNAQPASIQGDALLTVDVGDRSDDARMLLRKNNAVNLQDAGEVVPLSAHTPLSAPPAVPADPAAPNQAEPIQTTPEPPTPQTATFGGMPVVPPPLPIVTPPPSALGGLNAVGLDLAMRAAQAGSAMPPGGEATPASTAPARADSTEPAQPATREPPITGLDPAASADAAAGGGGLLPPVDDPAASASTNPEMHPTAPQPPTTTPSI